MRVQKPEVSTVGPACSLQQDSCVFSHVELHSKERHLYLDVRIHVGNGYFVSVSISVLDPY